MSDVEYDPAEQDYNVGHGSCLPLREGLEDSAGNRLTLAGIASTLTLDWHGGSLVLSTANTRLEITQDDDGADIFSGEITAEEIAALPRGRLTNYRWSITPAGDCPFDFKIGFFNTK